MSEQLDLFGGSRHSTPVVPPVTLYPRASRRSLRGHGRPNCEHCVMNARRWDDGEPVLGWQYPSDVVILEATALITHRDGSTLRLCVQHEREHEERGKRDG